MVMVLRIRLPEIVYGSFFRSLGDVTLFWEPIWLIEKTYNRGVFSHKVFKQKMWNNGIINFLCTLPCETLVVRTNQLNKFTSQVA